MEEGDDLVGWNLGWVERDPSGFCGRGGGAAQHCGLSGCPFRTPQVWTVVCREVGSVFTVTCQATCL